MAATLGPYLDCVRHTLAAALCLRNFPSQVVERHNKPEVEMQSSKELLSNPVLICRNEKEKTLIEASVNSVRVSVCLKKSDELDHLFAHKFTAFLMQRAEQFIIMRRRPVPLGMLSTAAGAMDSDVHVGVTESADTFDISFLVTNTHMEKLYKDELIDFIIQFMQDIDKEISEMKIAVNARARVVATEFMKEICSAK
eukprot:CAMPEP_0196780152 /NCGR_PEP_ID=MMETSP1104-20130614/7241_1 /TAXON_ID=33652 /ORGANISM="Cafeteria sp., Strain Caron Lab Isolate" /LENGTH=196 /DNA_ID=CAMNT_0042150343 /DNA_START=21 /DNA_END=611 /DNA_ORIENTATION=-